jgi:hypothetical protein
MKRREMNFLVVGLIIGLFLGMVLIGSSDDLRESLFGTAGGNKKADVEYYLVPLESAQTWLAEEYPEQSEQLKASFDVLAKLPVGAMPNADFNTGFVGAKSDVDYLLPRTYAALIGAKDAENVEAKNDDPTAACLGLDDDPYAGTTLYLYLTIPADQAEKMDIADDWQKLDDAKTNALYWKLLACFPEVEEK